MMNFNPLIRDKVAEFKASSPDFTFCQIVLSTLRQIKINFEPTDLLHIEDEDFYIAMEKAIKKEEV